eukprot:1160621-Pelagomonas_calceolata.AAC.3
MQQTLGQRGNNCVTLVVPGMVIDAWLQNISSTAKFHNCLCDYHGSSGWKGDAFTFSSSPSERTSPLTPPLPLPLKMIPGGKLPGAPGAPLLSNDRAGVPREA